MSVIDRLTYELISLTMDYAVNTQCAVDCDPAGMWVEDEGSIWC